MPILTDEERLGSTLAGKYVIDAIIGRGGMGAVFSGHHAISGRSVAIKVLHSHHARDPVAVHRFLNEAKTAAAFRHPNVVDVIDVDALDDGTVYLVLELLEGETLGELLDREKKLSVERTLSTLIPVLRAVAHANRMNIIHRDLKPDNIFLAQSKRGVVSMVLDFGIAKTLDGGEQSVNTVTGTILGTPQYMPPEQALGASESAPSLDVYAMGVVAFECLAGQRPIDGPTPTAILAKLINDQSTKLSSVAPDLAPSLVDIIEKAKSHDPEARFQTCDAFADALEQVAAQLGITVEIVDATGRLATHEGGRSQRLRTVSGVDVSARYAAVKAQSNPPPIIAETMDEAPRGTPSSGVAIPRRPHSTFAPTTSSRSPGGSPASLIGAAVAFVIVAGAGALTLRRTTATPSRRAPDITPTAAVTPSAVLPRPSAIEPALSVVRPTVTPPTTPAAVLSGTTASRSDAGASLTDPERRAARTQRVDRAHSATSGATAGPSAAQPQVARPGTTTTTATTSASTNGNRRLPEVAREW
jgi:serine/threonine protein kinase